MPATPASAGRIRFAPLTARSVLLSVLLGSHPPELPVRTLVRLAEVFGISEGAARVALSRLGSDGEVLASEGVYRLSPRLLSRQSEQDRAVKPLTRRWRGGWELAVAAPEVSAGERSAIGADLGRLRLAELRPGVWARPDNLVRPWPSDTSTGLWRFSGRPGSGDPSPGELAGRLWDLQGWSLTAESLMSSLRAATDTAERFVVAAAIVRHLREDPVLPQALLPRQWPGDRLRSAYEAYRRELRLLMRQELDHSSDPAGPRARIL